MNRTINQLVNALHLDPKREAAVRKIIENAGGVNDSTPVVTEVSGNELLPISVNGENKAVSAAALVKGAKEVLYVDITNIQEEGSFIMSYDDYKNHIVYFTITQNKLTFIAEKVFSTGMIYGGSVNYMDTYLFRNNAAAKTNENYPVESMMFVVNVDVNDNQVTLADRGQVNQIIPFSTGEGTKFLSDDGTYKEVSGGEGYVLGKLTPLEDYQYISDIEDNNKPFNITIESLYIDTIQTYFYGTVYDIQNYGTNELTLSCIGSISNYGGAYDGVMYSLHLTESGYSAPTDILPILTIIKALQPVIIEVSIGEPDFEATLTDEQIEAVENQNIKFKYNVNDVPIFAIPNMYATLDGNISIYCRLMLANGNMSDAAYVVNIASKTITAIA